jgi:hypothetical protein
VVQFPVAQFPAVLPRGSKRLRSLSTGCILNWYSGICWKQQSGTLRRIGLALGRSDRMLRRDLILFTKAAFAWTRCNSGWLFRPPIRRTTHFALLT